MNRTNKLVVALAFGLSLAAQAMDDADIPAGVPQFTACAWEPSACATRSAASAGAIGQFDFLNEKFALDQARAALAEIKANQKFWYGDFYPLGPAGLGNIPRVAWQLHRADLDAGLVLAFRRGECAYPGVQVNLRGLRAEARYAVEFINEARENETKTLTGRELMEAFELRLPKQGTSLLVRYKPTR
jgi:hypothetical protein